MFVRVLNESRARYGFQVLSFVAMPDHFHAILVPRPGDSLSQTMRFIKGTFARKYNEQRGASGPVWQSSFFDRAVRDDKALFEMIQYIEANPVQAALCRTPASYRFSSANPGFRTDLEKYSG